MSGVQAARQAWLYYAIAVCAAFAVVACGILFVSRTRQTLISYAHDEVQSLQSPDEGALPDLPMERGEIPEDFGTEVPRSLFVQLQIADILSVLWFVWVPIVFGIALAAAYLLAPR